MPTSPGPWTFEPKKGCKVIRDAANQEVAFTPGLTNDEEDTANARLIVSAPELLRWLVCLSIGTPGVRRSEIDDLLAYIHDGRR